MNPLHYPSNELCEKLTNIDFPETEIMLDSINPYRIGGMDVFPSVMEMLDVMPTIGWDTPKIVKNYIGWYVTFEGENHEIIWAGGHKGQCDNLPNALAEMILWLVENKYLTFNNDK